MGSMISGAAALKLERLDRLTAGDVVRFLDPATYSINGTSWAVVDMVTFVQAGDVRIAFDARERVGSYTDVEFEVRRNGVAVAFWSVSGTAYQPLSVDVAVVAGDAIAIAHRCKALEAAQYADFQNFSVNTGGGVIWPFEFSGKWVL